MDNIIQKQASIYQILVDTNASLAGLNLGSACINQVWLV
jgi:hypothetical protein